MGAAQAAPQVAAFMGHEVVAAAAHGGGGGGSSSRGDCYVGGNGSSGCVGGGVHQHGGSTPGTRGSLTPILDDISDSYDGPMVRLTRMLRGRPPKARALTQTHTHTH
jgi:hypothetical protein